MYAYLNISYSIEVKQSALVRLDSILEFKFQ